jgi:hypothetical protein
MSVHAAAPWHSWISPPNGSRRLISSPLGSVSASVESGGEQRESAVRVLAVVVSGVDAYQ